MLRSVVVVSSLVGLASAECPNGCSSHGKCTAYDMCLCYRNWMANDCSERICQFGLAHVDTPKGDLDASGGELDGPEDTVVTNSEMYPYGTTEQFPDTLDNSAHDYMECSNKGICDRQSGTCECFPGYEGSACQRASCPSSGGAVCSGHGTCETIKQISARDAGNIYELWDEESTLGCVCDAGYYGADCALRECKYGADPLYFDDNANIRFSTWKVEITSAAGTLSGQYAIVFYDHFGEDWQTEPIAYDADCNDIIDALHNIPNDVIPDGSVRCYKYPGGSLDNPNYASSFTRTTHVKYALSFRENPGLLKEITINKNLDGERPTLYTTETTSTLQIKVYADGFHGEDDDFVPDECEHVIVSFGSATFTSFDTGVVSFPVLTFSDPNVMIPLLKRCLGHSDNDLTITGITNTDVYNWDHGTMQNPHLVKFVPADVPVSTTLCKRGVTGPCEDSTPPGFFAPVIFKADSGGTRRFIVYSRASSDYSSSDTFRVFTTTGYLNRVSYEADVYTRGSATAWDYDHPNVVYTVNNEGFGSVDNERLGVQDDSVSIYGTPRTPLSWGGDIDCETHPSRDLLQEDCLSKNDWVMFFTMDILPLHLAANPKYHNIYQVDKIYKAYPEENTPSASLPEEPLRNRIVLNMHTNFFVPRADNDVKGRLYAYKFYPPTKAVKYVEQCSGRGLCNSAEGICECFPGYTNDDCSVQSAGAV